MKRDLTIDTLRGLSIFIMIAANMAAYVLAEPHPLGFRLYGSIAAPLFITIAGLLVVLTQKSKERSFNYFLLRGGLTVMVGALLDLLLWRVVPFMTVDVLYLIGLSLPLTYLFSQLGKRWQWILFLVIFALTPLLQKILGYSEYPYEVYYLEHKTLGSGGIGAVWRRWLIDGWFPIFPWLGFSFIGALYGQARLKYSASMLSKALSGWVLAALVLGAILFWMFPGPLYVREGYSEAFYPPTLGYCFLAIGVMALLFWIVDQNSQLRFFSIFRIFGECSLLMYCLHLLLIQWLIVPHWSAELMSVFLRIYLGLAAVLWGIAWGVHLLKKYWRHRHFLVQFFLGS